MDVHNNDLPLLATDYALALKQLPLFFTFVICVGIYCCLMKHFDYLKDVSSCRLGDYTANEVIGIFYFFCKVFFN